jgi:hypothetical protein
MEGWFDEYEMQQFCGRVGHTFERKWSGPREKLGLHYSQNFAAQRARSPIIRESRIL